MSLKDDFVKQAKLSNWHFDWFKATSLTNIINALNNFRKLGVSNYYVANTTQDLTTLTTAINNLKRDKALKADKYKTALDWLETKIPQLGQELARTSVRVGQTTSGYSPGKEVRLKDSDGHWHNFETQERGNSCGCASVRIILRAHTHIIGITEAKIQNMMGLVEDGKANKGIDTSTHNWDDIGSNVPSIVQVLHSYGIRDARAVSGNRSRVRSELENCSANEPGIIGWWWGPGYGLHDHNHSGHWTVCIGLNTGGTHLIILDPWNEIQYVPIGTFNEYRPGTGGYGWFNPLDVSDPAVIVTHPKA
jgi:hypothetical protein